MELGTSLVRASLEAVAMGGENGSRSGRLAMLAALAVGAGLRLFNIRNLVAGGDEIHAVRAALQLGFPDVLVTYRPGDGCLPMSSFYRLVLELGIPLDEAVLRAPVVISSIAIMIFVSLWARRHLSPGVGVATAWLLAISPLLVHYGRMIRSYSPIVLLGALAVGGFERWYRTGDRRAAMLYVVCAPLAGYFHLVALPFVLSPFLFAMVEPVVSRRTRRPSALALGFVGSFVALGCAAFLLPSLTSLLELTAGKRAGFIVTWNTIWRTMFVLAGSPWWVAVLLFWIAVGAGVFAISRRDSFLFRYMAILVIAQIAGVLVLAPLGMHQAIIFSRYVVIIIPVIAVAAGAGVDLVMSRISGRFRGFRPAPLVLLIGALFASGPLASPAFLTSPFAVRPESLLLFPRRTPVRSLPHLELYRDHVSEWRGPVVEFPWHSTWRYFSRVVAAAQEVHGLPVIVSPGERLLQSDKLSFRNMIPPYPDVLLASRASHVLVHLDPLGEDRFFELRRPLAPGSAGARDEQRREKWLRLFAGEANAVVDDLELAFGPPDFVDDGIVVWDLDRLRQTIK